MSRSARRTGVVALAAVLTVLAAAPAAATEPPPAPGYAPATAGPYFDRMEVFYRRPGGTVAQRVLSEGAGPATDLGGAISAAPAAVGAPVMNSYLRSWVFAPGTNGAVYYRTKSTQSGATWQAWTSLGGGTVDAPAASCAGSVNPAPVVWIRGGDGALWRRTLTTGWVRLGGALASAPAAVPATQGKCPPAQDVVALGTDGAVWELRAGTWSRIGGRSGYAPSIVRIPGSGVSQLYVIGTDGALYTAARNSDGAPWTAFSRVGGTFTSAPSAQLAAYGGGDLTVFVFALGGNQQIYYAFRDVLGAKPWAFNQLQ